MIVETAVQVSERSRNSEVGVKDGGDGVEM